MLSAFCATLLWLNGSVPGAGGMNALALLPSIADTGADSPSGVRRDFTLCHTGGGSNCVVDGDTMWLDGEKIRIANIDTPETHPPRCGEEARRGAAATDRLHALLNSGAVTTAAGADRSHDRHGRRLATVQVDGRDVGAQLIAAGLARPYGGGPRQGWC